MMRFLPTYHAVELMRAGAHPKEAARKAIKRITKKAIDSMAPLLPWLEMVNTVVRNPDGKMRCSDMP